MLGVGIFLHEDKASKFGWLGLLVVYVYLATHYEEALSCRVLKESPLKELPVLLICARNL